MLQMSERYSLDRFDTVFSLLAREPMTLREIVRITGWNYGTTNHIIRETRKLGSVQPPVKDRPGRFPGGAVVYRLVGMEE